LEKLIRDRAGAEQVESVKQQVAAALDPLVRGLRNAFSTTAAEPPTHPATPPSPADAAQSREAAVKLTTMLSELDPGAADFVEANREALRSVVGGERWPEFERLVQRYNFADAQTLLENALKSLPGART
jgi:hypothetical protein